VRSDEAEAADAAGAEAIAEKLADDYMPPPVTPGAPMISPFAAPPISPFASAPLVSPFAAPRQQQPGLMRTLSGGKKGAGKDDADLGKSLLDADSGDLAGAEAATAREGNLMQRDMSAEIKRAAADGDLDVAENLKAKKELPPLCGTDPCPDNAASRLRPPSRVLVLASTWL